MSGGTNPISSADQVAPAADPNSAAAVSKRERGATAQSKLASVGELREKAPEVHQAMLEGIAHTIIRRMQAHTRRMKELWRKGRDKR